MSDLKKVALVGNPNTGKSTLFNVLTGLNQKVGNFPGVTVDKKTGYLHTANAQKVEIVDLPGCYSLYPKSKDERIVIEYLCDPHTRPDAIVVMVDASNLKRNLLLCTQVADLGIPMVLALNMQDLAQKAGIEIDIDALSAQLGLRVVSISARNNQGLDQLKEAIDQVGPLATQQAILKVEELIPVADLQAIKNILNTEVDYQALQTLHQYEDLHYVSEAQREALKPYAHTYNSTHIQSSEINQRFDYIHQLLLKVQHQQSFKDPYTYSNKIDKIVTHKVWGFLIFLFVLFFIFNAIFSWSAYPMDLIENGFGWITEKGHELLPAGMLTDLLLDGVVAGLGGIVVFIPQIAMLFAFISILEDTGYMARVTFMMDKIMRQVGLSGKSVVPMIGGLACAVPSIMAARNIENWKDRIITIMVVPLVSCSARLPVYTLLIALVIPEQHVFGFINLQGLVLMLLYVLSLVMAIVVAWVFKLIIKTNVQAYFIMELPVYRAPRWNNVILTMFEKSKAFVFEAGKVIIAISIILWVMASFGPGNRFEQIEQKYAQALNAPDADEQHIQTLIATEKLENSYVGILGHAIEPSIRPLGYDWKIGIGLITSFAAREAFVSTMATIYSVDGGEEDTGTIRSRMAASINRLTGQPTYTLATGVSLMLFYAFAMQCMSTVAIVYRETKSIKWPLIQVVYMTALAYICALIAYQLLA